MPKGTDNAATGLTQNPSGSTKVTWGLRSKVDTVSPEGGLHRISAPTDIQNKDTIFMIIATSVAATVASPTGFKLIKSVDKKLHFFYKEASGREQTTFTTSVSPKCQVLASTSVYYGLSKSETISFAFNNSTLSRTLTPMPSVTSAYKNGLLIHAVASLSSVSWSGWTSGTTEISDLKNGTNLISLAVAATESTTTGTSPLVEVTASAATVSVSLTVSINSTGIETYFIGNKYTGSNTCTSVGLGCNVSVNTASLNVRSSPSLSGSVIGSVTSGRTGMVIEGPVTADGYTWWRVDYGSVSGWSAGSLLLPIASSEKFYLVNDDKYVLSVAPDAARNSWIYAINTYGGRNTAVNSTIKSVVYDIDSVSNKPSILYARTENIVFNTGTKSSTSGGETKTEAIAWSGSEIPIRGFPVAKGKKVALGFTNNGGNFATNLRNYSTGDMSIYNGAAVNGVPVYNISSETGKSVNQGLLPVWAWTEGNIEPEAPELISPNSDAIQRNLRPTFLGSFRDCNGRYGSTSGLGADRGDMISKYDIRFRKKTKDLTPLLNGIFDLNINGWGNEVKSTGLTTSITQDTTTKYSGSASLKVDVTGNTSGVSGTYIILDHADDIEIVPKISYTLSWAGYSRTTAMTPKMRIAWISSNNTVVSYSTISWTGFLINTWYQKELVAVAPENAVKMRVQIYTEITNSTSQGSVNYDNISIDKTTLFTESFTATENEKYSHIFERQISTSLENNTEYEWSARTADTFEEWGPWSSWKSFLVSLTGPITALYPNAAELFSDTNPGYYQYTTRPDFVYKWESGDDTKMYKFDFEISSYEDFRTPDYYRKSCYGATFSSKIATSTLLNGVNSFDQTEIFLQNNGNFTYDSDSYGEDKNLVVVLKIGTEYILVEEVNKNSVPYQFNVRRGYFGSFRNTYSVGTSVEIYLYNLKEAWTNNNQVTHVLPYNLLNDNGTSFAPLEYGQKYYWRMRGYDTNNIPSVWSKGSVNKNDLGIYNIPSMYSIDSYEIAKLRSNSHRYKLYFCVWDTWKFYSKYPRLTWIKGSDTRNPDDYTKEAFDSGNAPYEIRFPVETPSEQVNVNIQQSGFAILGDYGEEDFKCVVNIGSNRLAFVNEFIQFSAEKSWTRGNNPGTGWDSSKFSWTFENGANRQTATGAGPIDVKWSGPGLYTVTCAYDGQPPVSRKVRVYQDRYTTDYDVVEVGSITGGADNGWNTSITIKTQSGNTTPGNLTDIQEFQSVGIFCEEEWEVDGQWIRSPISFYESDPSCLITGYIQNGSIKIDANTHTFSFNINPVSEQLKLVTMFGTQTWSYDYYQNIALVATPELIPQGSTITFTPMYLVDVVLHILQSWTNVLERHDFIGWYDTSLQSRDTVSTNEGPIWQSLSQIADVEYAWLFTDPGNGIHFEPNPSLRSWGAFGDLHPIPYILDDRDIWNIDVQQKLMNTINYCQVTGTRPYFPNSVFEGKYPSSIPEGVLGQWLIKTGQLFSSQWFADYMAENMYWDANRKITANMVMGMNRKIHVPGRVFVSIDIPERNLYFESKEFYVTSATYTLSPAEGKFTTGFQLIENMRTSSEIVGVRKVVTASGYVGPTDAKIEARAILITADNNVIAITTLASALNSTSTTVSLTNASGMEAGSLLKIDNEIMLILAINQNNVTVQRAFSNTSVASHNQLATVRCIAYFKDNTIEVGSTGHVGKTSAQVVASYYLISVETKDVSATGEVIRGPYEVKCEGIVRVPDIIFEVEANAHIQTSLIKEVSTSYVLQITKTRSIFADGVII